MKRFLLTSTAILCLAILNNSFAQAGGTTGGGTGTGTPTQKQDDKSGGTTGGKSGSGGTTTGAGSGGSAKGTGTTGSTGGGAAIDMKNLKALPAEGTTCCADIFYRDTKKGMVLVAENPFGGKYEGRKVSFQLKDSNNKIVASNKYKVMRDPDNNLVIVPNGLTGKGYSLNVTINDSKESSTFKINLM